jgi:hypothetical protein
MSETSNTSDLGFVADGQDRILKSAEAEDLRQRILARYSLAISRSSGRRRMLLERACEREIARRLEELAPSDALYLFIP